MIGQLLVSNCTLIKYELLAGVKYGIVVRFFVKKLNEQLHTIASILPLQFEGDISYIWDDLQQVQYVANNSFGKITVVPIEDIQGHVGIMNTLQKVDNINVSAIVDFQNLITSM
jgi:hypothetical protein